MNFKSITDLIEENDWVNIYQREFNSSDLAEMIIIVQELKKLIFMYNENIANRSELKKEIVKKAQLLSQINDIYETKIDEINRKYSHIGEEFDNYNDIIKIFDIILNYTQNDYNTYKYSVLETKLLSKHNNISQTIEKELILLGKNKEIIESIDQELLCKEQISDLEAIDIILNIISNNNNLLIFTDSQKINYKLTQLEEMYQNLPLSYPYNVIYFSKKSDMLNKTFNGFKEYITEYGTDMHNIPNSILVECVKDKMKEKTKNKA